MYVECVFYISFSPCDGFHKNPNNMVLFEAKLSRHPKNSIYSNVLRFHKMVPYTAFSTRVNKDDEFY